MGDRAVVLVKDAACGMYLHWAGREALDILTRAIPRMRSHDANYSMARLIGHAHSEVEGNCSLGVVPPPKDYANILGSYSPGDAGVVLYDCETGVTQLSHGSLADEAKENPLKLPVPPE